MKTSQSLYTRHLSTNSTLCIAVAGLMAALSLAGLLFTQATYSGKDLRQSFIANDVVNLRIGLPTLLGALWLIRRGKLPGLLGPPGALSYVIYNSIAYAAAITLAGATVGAIHGLALIDRAPVIILNKRSSYQ